MKVKGQLHAPANLPLEKHTTLPIVQMAECAAEPVWTRWRREISLQLSGIERPLSTAESDRQEQGAQRESEIQIATLPPLLILCTLSMLTVCSPAKRLSKLGK